MDQHLYTLLTRGETRELPRRAALVHGEIVELYIAPKYTQECHLLSRICEVVRESRGEEIYSRDPMVLLHHCLYRNDERAWAALSEDAMCGLLTCDSLKTYFEERPDDAACFVWRFQDAHSMVHSACILKVFSECIECLSPDAMRVFAQSLLRRCRGRAHACLSCAPTNA